MENGVDTVMESDRGEEIFNKNGILESRLDGGVGEIVGHRVKRDSEADEVFEEAIDGNLEETDPLPLQLSEALPTAGGGDGEDEVCENFQDAATSERDACDGTGMDRFEEAVQRPVEDGAEARDEPIAPAVGGGVDGDENSDLGLRCGKENGNGTVTLGEDCGLERNGVVDLEDGPVVESPGQIVDEDFRNSTVKEQEEGIDVVVKSSKKEHFSEVDPVIPENGDCSLVESNEVCSQPGMLANGDLSCHSDIREKLPGPDLSLVEKLNADVAVKQFIDLENSRAEVYGSNEFKCDNVTESADVGSTEEIQKESDNERASPSGVHSSADASGLPKGESHSVEEYGKLVSYDKDETEATVTPMVDVCAEVYKKQESENDRAGESREIHLRSENASDDAICGVIEEIPETKVEEVSSLHKRVKILPGEMIQRFEVEANVDEGLKVDDSTEEQLRDMEDSQAGLSAISPVVQSKQVLVAQNVDIGKTEELADEKKRENPGANSFHSSATIIDSPGRESVHVGEFEDSVSTDDDEAASTIAPPLGDKCSTTRSLSDVPPPARPAGLGSSAPLLEPAPRAPLQPRVNGSAQERHTQLVEEPINGETDEYDETREKLQMIRVKFLRLAHRLGQTPHNTVVAQVLYRLGLAEQLRGSRMTSRAGAFSFDRASAMAEQLEAGGQEPLDFSCTILVLGKTGVGKSATINSIFDEVKFNTDAFELGTKKFQDIVGTVQGIKVRVIDTPGLLTSCADQRRNEKILNSVKSFIKKNPPDIVLYLDRLDMQSRDYGDVPLLRTITNTFGHSIWFNAIVVLTHAASAPPDGPNGIPMSYEMFVTQRSHVVQQAIRQAAGDVRLMNPVSLVENHSACRTNRAGQRVLPNGQVWKPQLLLLSFASKILAEANTLLKLQDNPPGKPFSGRPRVPPLPFLLSSLLQSRPQLKLPEEQFGDDDNLEEDLDDTSDSDNESEYDELPPFKRLTKAQLANLSKAQKKAYFDELEYREKLFMKKQLKEEKKRRKLLKKMADAAKDVPNDCNESAEEETGGPASVPVPMPDLALPTSFDADNPTHRYRYLDSSNWLVRPVLESHGWDHDVGYEGLNVERLFVVKEKIPVSFSGQVTKDKKDCNLQMEVASSLKHGDKKATSFGFDMQTLGKELLYTLRSETRFCNFRCNTTSAGLSVAALGDSFTAGMKIEDRLMVHKRFRLVMTGGAMTSRGDVAYGGSLEATLRDKDYPLGRTLSTIGLSIMDWHGDLAIGGNAQTQFPVGRNSNIIARANLNNKGSGQLSIRVNSSEQLQIAFIALVPVIRSIVKNKFLSASS